MLEERSIRARRKQRRRKMRQKKRLIYMGAFLGVMVVFVFTLYGIQSILSNEKTTTEEVATLPVEMDPLEIEISYENIEEEILITVSGVGDCTLGTDVGFDPSTNFTSQYEASGSGFFFENVKKIFEQDDLTIVNLEGTLTTETARADKTFAFKGDPSYVDILTQGNVEAANLANNHSKDYGEQSFVETKEVLEANDIVHFGYEDTAIIDIKGVKVGLVGIYELRLGIEIESELIQRIEQVKEEGAQLIIVSFHWGNERETMPEDTQISLAHTAIDEGADLVLGHHPHVLQGVEKYKGKYIAYSLGNFCFGGNKNPSDKDTMIFQQTFTISSSGVLEDDNLSIIPCSISSSSSRNNYQPTPLVGEEKNRVKEKIISLSSADLTDMFLE